MDARCTRANDTTVCLIFLRQKPPSIGHPWLREMGSLREHSIVASQLVVTGFVVRMERMRNPGSMTNARLFPDFTSLHLGYELHDLTPEGMDVYDSLGRHIDFFIDYLEERISSSSSQTPSEKKDKAKRLLVLLVEAISFAIIKKIVNSVGHETLSKTFEVLKMNNRSIPFHIIDVGVKLDHFTHFPDTELDDLLKLCGEKVFPVLILRDLVIEHFYLFPTEITVKQKYCQKLNVELQFIEKLGRNYKTAVVSEKQKGD